MFLGLGSFCLYIFLSNYFREREDGQRLDLAQDSIYLAANLEAVYYLSKFTGYPSDMVRMVSEISASPRVKFILSEIGAGSEFLSRITANGTYSSDKSFENMVRLSLEIASLQGSPRLTTAHMFYVLIIASVNQKILPVFEMDKGNIEILVFWAINIFEKIESPKTLIDKMKASSSGVGQDWASGYTLELNRFSSDITSPKCLEPSQ
jgi:hypothetical protein